MRTVGEVTHADVMMEGGSGRSKGCGLVTFAVRATRSGRRAARLAARWPPIYRGAEEAAAVVAAAAAVGTAAVEEEAAGMAAAAEGGAAAGRGARWR